MTVTLTNRFDAAAFGHDTDAAATAVAEAVEADGYAIVEGVIDPATCAALVAEVQRIEADENIEVGTNEFEGVHTRRIFNLIARSEHFRDLVIDPTLLAVVEAILGEDFLLSGTTSMHIEPDETPQLLHADDGMITLPRPHPATLVTTLWALTDFTAANGATQVVSGSHRFPTTPKPGDAQPSEPVVMPAGSMVVLHGSTWHGGGANTTADEHRYGLSLQFVAGWCRQQQNLMLGTPREEVAAYPERLQELIGYAMFRNVMGHVDRKHPQTLLGNDVEPSMVWEKLKR